MKGESQSHCDKMDLCGTLLRWLCGAPKCHPRRELPPSQFSRLRRPAFV